MIHCGEPIPPAARAYIDAVPAGDWFLFDMSPLDVTGIPAWKAAYVPSDPVAAGCEIQQGTGYGEDAAQAIIAAVAECFEEVHARLGFARLPQVTGSYTDLTHTYGQRGVADPFELCLPAGSPIDRDTPLRWVAATRWFDGDPVLVPIDLAALSTQHFPSGYRPFTPLITNGLGAGPSVAWAAAHGLFECLQRDGNGLRLRALDAKVGLTFDPPPPARLADLAARIAGAGIELLPKFATDEFGLVNVYVVGADRDPGRLAVPIALTGCGEAADPDRDVALRKALLEYAHARARKAFAFGPLDLVRRVMPAGYWEIIEPRVRRAALLTEPRQVAAFKRWLTLDGEALRDLIADPILTVETERAFTGLAQAATLTPEAKGADAARRLIAAGMDPLVLDFSPPGGSMHAVRVIVPGLEVETMSYHRIGERNAAKLIAADSRFIRWGEPTARCRPIALTDDARERLGGVPLLDVAAVDAVAEDFYPLYREPGAHEMAFAQPAE